MRITLNQAQIEQGLRLFIESQGFNTEGKTIEIDLKATRGPEGYTADILIPDAAGNTASSASTPASLDIESKVTTAKASKSTPATEEADSTPVEPEAPAEAEPEVEAESTDDSANEPVAEVEEDTAEDTPEVPATNARKSLFGDAKRPVNA